MSKVSKSRYALKPQSTSKDRGAKTPPSKSGGERGKTPKGRPSSPSANTEKTKTSTRSTNPPLTPLLPALDNVVLALMFKATVEALRDRGLLAVVHSGVNGVPTMTEVLLDANRWNPDLTLKGE